MIKLDRLVNVLGGYGARLWCAPHTRDAELRGVSLYDPAQPRAEDVLLAIGVESPEAATTLLSTTDAVVVVLRGSALDNAAVASATRRGVGVLLVEPAVSWDQLAGVVYGLVLEGRETEAGRGPADLFALADSLAESVGGAVTIENRYSAVLAYSSQRDVADSARLDTILGRRVPEKIRTELAARGVFTHLSTSDEPMFVEPMESGGFHGRAVIAVRAGRELLGSIWVEVTRPLPGPRRAALVEGARTAALHMLRVRASADLERQIESDLVIGLLEGHADAQTTVSRLGLRGTAFRVVAVRMRTEEEHDVSALLAFEYATTGFGWTRPGRSALFANTLYTVLPCGEDSEPAVSWVRALVANLPAEPTVYTGIGGTADAPRLTVSFQEADESLAVSVPGRVTVYDDAWHEILLWRLRNAAAAGRVPPRGPVAELRRHDAEQGTRYAETLRGWLECQGDLAEAGARLGVHPNTVRYRLRRMTEVTALDLEDPDKRLAMLIGLVVG